MANTIRDELNDDYLTEAQKDLPVDNENLTAYKSLLRRRIDADAANPQKTDAGGYAQVDLRPDWYKTFLGARGYDKSAPPLQSKPAATVEAGLGFMGNAATDRAKQLQGSDRGTGHAVGLSNTGALLGLGSVLVGALSKKDSNDFDTQQARAVKDASALKKNSKTGLSTNELLGAANLEKTSLRNDQLWRRDAEKAAGAIADADLNSKNSRRAQVGAASSGMVAPETANELSAGQLKDNRTGFMQSQQQEHHDKRFDYERGQLENEKLGEEERSDLRRIDQEHREQYQHRLQSQVPGYRWQNDTPPQPAVVAQARDLATSREEMMNSAERLAKIQSKLEEMRGMAAAVGQNVDAFIGPQYSKDLLAEAKLVQSKMTTAARKLDQMGVPQQFELDLQNSLNPVAGSIGAYFRGTAPWTAIHDYYQRTGRNQLNKMGLFEENDEARPNNDPLAQPVEGQVRRYTRSGAAQAPVGAPASSLREPANAPAAGDTLPVARGAQPKVSAQPAPQQAADTFDAPGANDVMNGQWVITTGGGPSKPRQLTKKQYKMAIQAGYKVEQVK